MPITTILIPLFQEPIVIDRVEENQVIIEWEDLSLSSLPVEIFPAPPKEGDQFFITGQSSVKGNCELKYDAPVILECPNETLYLPIEISSQITKTTPLTIDFSISL